MKRKITKVEDLTGRKFGKLTVIERVGTTGSIWKCQCDCEERNYKEVPSQRLKNGDTKSCGCIYRKHLLSGTSIYNVWKTMIDRCYNKEYHRYHDWGGRGIKVCDEWKGSVRKFAEWCIKNGWDKNLQIDRIDNDKNYEPGNIRFVTSQFNSFNRRKQSNNTSGYRGVSYREGSNTYRSRVFLSRKIIMDKSGFETAKDAAIARDMFVIENGLFLPLNFPELKVDLF